jgi:hypothetical protein
MVGLSEQPTENRRHILNSHCDKEGKADILSSFKKIEEIENNKLT